MHVLGQVAQVPGVALYFLNRDPAVLLRVQHACDKVFHLVIQMAREFVHAVLDFLEHFLVALFVKGQFAAQHGLQNHADRPHVAGFTRLRDIFDNLRRGVVG